jgi:hypothetical protein
VYIVLQRLFETIVDHIAAFRITQELLDSSVDLLTKVYSNECINPSVLNRYDKHCSHGRSLLQHTSVTFIFIQLYVLVYIIFENYFICSALIIQVIN